MKLKNIFKDNKNKKGFMGFVFFFLILFTILIIGVIGTLTVAIVEYTSEVITPVMQDIGMAGSTNVSQAAEYTFGTVDKLVGSLSWLLAFGYVAMLIFSIIFVVSYNFNPNPVFIGIYFVFVILLIFGAIILSNMYEDLYNSTDEVIGDGLKEQVAMSFMILHSPWILSLIAFIVGIYIFAGKQSEQQGGFDI